MEARLRYVIPLTLVLVVALLYLSMRGWPQTFLVLSSLPFAVAGSVWLLAFMHYNLSTAVWVGLIAVAGVAAETGIVMVVYLDEAFERYMREGRIQKPADVDAAVVEGAAARVRPLMMTVATTVLGLLPLLWESGVGADVSARTAAPVVGGLWSCMLLTLLVLPAAYAMWRRTRCALATAVLPPHGPAATKVQVTRQGRLTLPARTRWPRVAAGLTSAEAQRATDSSVRTRSVASRPPRPDAARRAVREPRHLAAARRLRRVRGARRGRRCHRDRRDRGRQRGWSASSRNTGPSAP